MSTITGRFACGHPLAWDPAATTVPVCAVCGERRIAQVTAPPPTFRGVATGPHAVHEDLGPIRVDLTQKE
jgi:hypothetical protein